MKTLSTLFFAAILIFGFGANAYAQAAATAGASATIVTPISITKTTDMSFGNIAVSATTGGDVTLTTADARNPTPGGGVTLPAITGTVTSAAFTVNGNSNYTYAITLPGASLSITYGTGTMTVDQWSSSPSGTGQLSGGAQTLKVGATLHVSAAQHAGSYTSGATPFSVTVNYN